MRPLYRKIHSSFKLNGKSFTPDELKEVAYSFVKEGDSLEREIGDFLLDWLDESSTLQVHTSGSTGKPKTITLRKSHMANSALATGKFLELKPGDSALMCLPVVYIAGKMMLVRAVVLGLELDYVIASSKPLIGIRKSYDFCAMVPLQLENSLDRLYLIKILIVGGAPISHVIRQRLERLQVQKLPHPKAEVATVGNFSSEIFETYGMTETITHIALKKLKVGLVHTPKNIGSMVIRQTGNINFKTLPGITVSIDDRHCLRIDAPKISEAAIVTNDVVKLISNIEFQWLGRYDNIINSGGVKLFPEQIEAKLEPIINGRFYVAGLADERLGQKLVLIVEGESEKETISQKIHLLKTLERFEVPKEIHHVAHFLDTDSGKIRREDTLREFLISN